MARLLAVAVSVCLALTSTSLDARPTRKNPTSEIAASATAPGADGVSTISNNLVDKARSHLGQTAAQLGLPRRLWCADFMNLLLGGGTGSRLALAYLNYGTRLSGPHIGAIAVMSRGRRGGHVGVVSGIAKNGNPIIISGNHGRVVGEGVYPRSRILAYVTP